MYIHIWISGISEISFFFFEPEGNFYFFHPLKVMPSFDPRPSAKSTAGDGSMEEKGPRRLIVVNTG